MFLHPIILCTVQLAVAKGMPARCGSLHHIMHHPRCQRCLAQRSSAQKAGSAPGSGARAWRGRAGGGMEQRGGHAAVRDCNDP